MSKDFIRRVDNKRTLFQQVLHNSKNTKRTNKKHTPLTFYKVMVVSATGVWLWSLDEDKESSLSTRVTETKFLRPPAALRLKSIKETTCGNNRIYFKNN
jgi:hypothetical protein